VITRADIYSKEAAELLRLVSMYPGMKEKQICGFFSDKKDKIPIILEHLARQKRIKKFDADRWLPFEGEEKIETDLLRAVWVLLDFKNELEFHCNCEYPVQLLFFAHGETFEIITVHAGQEVLLSRLLEGKEQGIGKRILMIDDLAQMKLLRIPGVVGVCMVQDEEGNVQYYRKWEGE